MDMAVRSHDNRPVPRVRRLRFVRAALVAAAGAALGLAGCASGRSAQQEMVAEAMQQSMQADLTILWQASLALQDAAPTPNGRGWSATADASAIDAMKSAWIQARTAYEHVEGAVAPLFPAIDTAIDARYDAFLATAGPNGDPDPFDGDGFTGMHALERILYADVIPANVVAFEMTLPGYEAAAFPATDAQATRLKADLCARLVTDTKTLLDDWKPQKIDISGAFQGLVELMDEQQNKVNKAATGEEESRYSQRTMADLRANLDGTTTIYALFRDWLQSKSGATPSGADIDAMITAKLAALQTVYDGVAGDAIPAPPANWNATSPSADDLATPFGMLYQAIHQAVDPDESGSIVQAMNMGAALLGIPPVTGL
jgi:iron uptake system component EfeO